MQCFINNQSNKNYHIASKYDDIVSIIYLCHDGLRKAINAVEESKL